MSILNDASIEFDLLQKLKEALNNNIHIIKYLEKEKISEKELNFIKVLQLLTIKPALYLLNTNHSTAAGTVPAAVGISMNVREELDSADLSSQERKELQLKDTKIKELIGKTYSPLVLGQCYGLLEGK